MLVFVPLCGSNEIKYHINYMVFLSIPSQKTTAGSFEIPQKCICRGVANNATEMNQTKNSAQEVATRIDKIHLR